MENYQKQKPRGKLMPKRYSHGPMTWRVMPRNAWRDFANWQQTRQLYKIAIPCMDDHRFEEEIRSVGEVSTVFSQMVLKCLFRVLRHTVRFFFPKNWPFLFRKMMLVPLPCCIIWCPNAFSYKSRVKRVFWGKNVCGREKSRSVCCALWCVSHYFTVQVDALFHGTSRRTISRNNQHLSLNLIRSEPGSDDNLGWEWLGFMLFFDSNQECNICKSHASKWLRWRRFWSPTAAVPSRTISRNRSGQSLAAKIKIAPFLATPWKLRGNQRFYERYCDTLAPRPRSSNASWR